MKRYLYRVAIGSLGVGLWTLPVVAHHSIGAIYDTSKSIDITGVLTKVQWENPHMWVYLDVTDASGKVTTWEFEGASPNNVSRNGTSRKELLSNIGKSVTVRAIPARNGAPRGSAESITVGNGTALIIGTNNETRN
jgi:hypothetical protein